jgi:hypothetical protein
MKFNFLFQVFFLLLILSRGCVMCFLRAGVHASLLGAKTVSSFDVSHARCALGLLIHPVRSATFWLVCIFSLVAPATNVKNYKTWKNLLSETSKGMKQQSKREKRSEIFDGLWCLFWAVFPCRLAKCGPKMTSKYRIRFFVQIKEILPKKIWGNFALRRSMDFCATSSSRRKITIKGGKNWPSRGINANGLRRRKRMRSKNR